MLFWNMGQRRVDVGGGDGVGNSGLVFGYGVVLDGVGWHGMGMCLYVCLSGWLDDAVLNRGW